MSVEKNQITIDMDSRKLENSCSEFEENQKKINEEILQNLISINEESKGFKVFATAQKNINAEILKRLTVLGNNDKIVMQE